MLRRWLVGNSYGTVEETGMVVSSCEIAGAMAKVENNCWVALAEETSESNSAIFEASVSSASNWWIVEEKAENI